MKENEENLQIECDLSRDDAAYTDDIKPSVPKNGNPIPETVVSFFATAFFFSFGLFLLFGDINVTPELFGSQIGAKIFVFVIMLVISCLFLLYAIASCKRAKTYYCQKREFEKLPIDPNKAEDSEKYTVDGLHFNNEGQLVLAQTIGDFLEDL